MSKMNKLRNYEILGVPIIMMTTIVFASILSNVGDGVQWRQLIALENISLFQIAQYMFISIIMYSGFEYAIFGDDYKNFIFAKASTALASPSIFLFLTYFFNATMIYNDQSLYVATFFIAVCLGQLLSYYFLNEGYYFKLMNAYGLLTFIMLLMLFYVFADNRMFSSPLFEPITTYENIINRIHYMR